MQHQQASNHMFTKTSTPNSNFIDVNTLNKAFELEFKFVAEEQKGLRKLLKGFQRSTEVSELG